MKNGLESREKVYQFVRSYIGQYGYAPSVRDICEGTGLASTSTVFAHLRNLAKAGLIRKTGNQPRCLVLVEDYPVNTIADMAKAYVSRGKKPPDGLSASSRKLFDVMVELVKYGRVYEKQVGGSMKNRDVKYGRNGDVKYGRGMLDHPLANVVK